MDICDETVDDLEVDESQLKEEDPGNPGDKKGDSFEVDEAVDDSELRAEDSTEKKGDVCDVPASARHKLNFGDVKKEEIEDPENLESVPEEKNVPDSIPEEVKEVEDVCFQFDENNKVISEQDVKKEEKKEEKEEKKEEKNPTENKGNVQPPPPPVSSSSKTKIDIHVRRNLDMRKFEGQVDDMEGILRLVKYKIENAVSIDIIRRTLSGVNEKTTFVTWMIKHSQGLFNYLQNVLLDRMINTKREVLYFENDIQAQERSVVCCTLKKRTKTSREHVVFWGLVWMKLAAHNFPEVGFVRSYIFTGQ